MQGIAVHIAARIAAIAAASEILVSRTVKDLVAGSGLRFNDRGRHSLKGLQEAMELYAAPRKLRLGRGRQFSAERLPGPVLALSRHHSSAIWRQDRSFHQHSLRDCV